MYEYIYEVKNLYIAMTAPNSCPHEKAFDGSASGRQKFSTSLGFCNRFTLGTKTTATAAEQLWTQFDRTTAYTFGSMYTCPAKVKHS